MVRELVAAPPERAMVTDLTDAAMLERYGDLSSNEAIAAAADAAIHNKARARSIATEHKALHEANSPVQKIGTRRYINLLTQAASMAAKAVIDATKLFELRPGGYAAQAARAGRRAKEASAEGNTAVAIAEKRAQLLNTELAGQTHDAIALREKQIAGLRNFNRPAVRARVDLEYMDQIDGILSRFELSDVPQKVIGQRAQLRTWLEAQTAANDFPFAVSEDIQNEAYTVNYSEMTVQEFNELVDAVTSIHKNGTITKKLLVAHGNADLAFRRDAAALSVEQNARKTIPDYKESTGLTRIKGGASDFHAFHRKLSSMVIEQDGGTPGVLWETIVRPMNDKGNWEVAKQFEFFNKLDKLFAPILAKKNLTTQYKSPGLDESFSREGLLTIAFNQGNTVNRQRVVEGEAKSGWTQADVDQALTQLDKDDWAFVQNVWNLINEFKEPLQAMQARITGVRPEMVEAEPFTVTTKDGDVVTMAGGYYPIVANRIRSGKALEMSKAEMFDQLKRNALGNAATVDGFSKARGESGLGPILYEFAPLVTHINNVIHHLAWKEWLLDTNRLLKSGGSLDLALRKHHGASIVEFMHKAIEDIAVGMEPARSVFERFTNRIRNGVTVVGLGWNLTTAAMQITGYSNSVSRIGAVAMANGMTRWVSDPESNAAWVHSVSTFMKHRDYTFNREVNDIRQKFELSMPKGLQDSYFYFIAKMQMTVDMPTWLGEYYKQMAETQGDESKSIALADQAIIDSQGSGGIKDLSAIQRGGPLLKLFTNFMSYMNMSLNAVLIRVRTTDYKSVADIARLSVDILLLAVIPSVAATLLKEGIASAFKGKESDEEKLKKKLFQEQAGYLLGMFSITREMYAAYAGFKGYEGPAGLRFYSELGKLGKELFDGDDEIDTARALKLTNTAAGIYFHYPAAAIERAVTGVMSWEDQDASWLAPIVGPAKQ